MTRPEPSADLAAGVRPPPEPAAGRPAARFARLRAALARLKRPIFALAAVGTVLGGLAGWWNGYRTVVDTAARIPPASATPAAATPRAAPANDRRMTFAVLPFTGPSGDAEAARLVVAAFESVQTLQEARTNWARVAPRAQVHSALATPGSLRQLGQALDVHFLLRGTITRGATGYGLDLAVLDVQTEAPLALRSIPFEAGPATPAVPRRTLDHALGWLTYAALKQEVARARSKPDASLDARDLTYRAYVDSSSENTDRPAAYAKAQQGLERALALAPDDPLALSLTAQINLCECLRAWATDTGEMERIGEAALDKALAARPDATSLLTLRAWLLVKRGRHEDALLLADQVLAREPDDLEALRLRFVALFKLGRIEQAVAAVPVLLRAGDDWWTQASAAAAQFAAGDDVAAIQSARKALVQMSQGERADAVHGIVALVLVAAEARAGRLDRAQAALKDYHAAAPEARTRAAIEARTPSHAVLPDTPAFWDALRRAGLGS